MATGARDKRGAGARRWAARYRRWIYGGERSEFSLPKLACRRRLDSSRHFELSLFASVCQAVAWRWVGVGNGGVEAIIKDDVEGVGSF